MTTTQRKERNMFIGIQIDKLLVLHFDGKGETNTSWGTKSREGLGAVITRIVEDAVQQYGGKIMDDVRQVCNNGMDTDVLS